MFPPNFPLKKWQRNTFLAFDTFLAASGLVILSLGLTYHVSYNNTSFKLKYIDTDAAAIILLVLGFTTFPIAYLSFYAAVSGRAPLIRICSIAIFILAILKISTGFFFVVSVRNLKSSLQDPIIAADLWNNRGEHMIFWNTVQYLLDCCGYGEGAAGWLPDLPASCCYQQTTKCQPKLAHRSDCKHICCNYSTGYVDGYVSIGIGLLELCGAVLIFMLYLATHHLQPPSTVVLSQTQKK